MWGMLGEPPARDGNEINRTALAPKVLEAKSGT